MITEPRWKSYIVETTTPIFTPKQCQMIIEAGRAEPKQEAYVGNDERTRGGIIDTIRDMNVSLTYTNKPFIEGFFKEVYPLYTQKYSHLKKLTTHNILEVKIQKTKVGEGYHFWHCENAEMKARNRILAFMVYLNDVTEGG